MRKLYIAGPMTGRVNFNYPAFERAELILADAGYEVLSPTAGFSSVEARTAAEGDNTWNGYMRLALRLVIDSSGVALLPGWEESEGAKFEVDVATRLGIGVWPLDEWLLYKTPDDLK